LIACAYTMFQPVEVSIRSFRLRTPLPGS
jgi:hypothetical protein